MVSFIEDDGKEGRYFPTDEEIPILVNHLQVYFSHPERSAQRSQVVQKVVSLLTAKSNHWSHRTVRLWFNNNKRVFFHPKDGNVPSAKPEKVETTSSFLPPKKVMPHHPQRSLSVVQFPRQFDSDTPFVDKMPRPIARLNQPIMTPMAVSYAPMNFPNQLNLEHERLAEAAKDMGRSELQVQRESEAKVTSYAQNLHEQEFNELVMMHPQHQSAVIKDMAAFMDDRNSRNYRIAKKIDAFQMIEAGIVFGRNEPAVVAYVDDNEEQHLCYGGMKKIIGLYSPVSSMTFSSAMGQFFVHADGVIKIFSSHNLEYNGMFKSGTRRSHTSAMTFWGNNLVLSSGSSILCWSNESFQSEEPPQFTTCLTSYLNTITSITTVSNMLVVGSNEHHTPHVFAKNGTIVYRPIGHVGGITALSTYDHFCFLSGSADQTAKLWDIRTHIPVISILRHRGIITSVTGGDGKVYTGGTDGVIKAWDLRMNSILFTSETGSSAPLAIGASSESLVSIISEKASEFYIDLQKYGSRPSESINYQPNGILTITL